MIVVVNTKARAKTLALVLLLASGLFAAWRSTAPTLERARKPQHGDMISVVIVAEPLRLDPHDATDAPSALINFHLYERLVELTPDGEVVPGLAESWTISDDGTTYVFKLRENVRFHDGLPLTAAAVVANFERLLSPETALARADLISPFVQSAAALDTYTVEIRLRQPVGSFLRLLAHEALGIVSPLSIRASQENRSFRPVGTGPFALYEWVPGDRVTLVAFQDHWRGAPRVAGLVFKPMPDGSSRAIALETGAADVAYPLDPIHMIRLRAFPEIEVRHAPSQRVIYAAFNLGRPPLDDVEIRRALNHAVDRDAIARHLLFGLARPLDSPVAPSTWGHSPVLELPYDPERAVALLSKKGGIHRPLHLWSPSARYVQDRAVAEAIAGYWRAVGIDVNIRLFEWGTYLSLLSTSDQWDVAVLGWVPATGEADMALRPIYHSLARGNHSGYRSAAIDRLLDQAIATGDARERLELYRQIQSQIALDAPVLFLHSPDLTYGYRSDIAGIRVHSTEIIDLRAAYRRNRGG